MRQRGVLYLVGLLALTAGCIFMMPALAQQSDPPPSVRTKISFPVSRSGIFDPSLADTGPKGRHWMSYTAVDPSQRFGEQNTRTETTRLAFSDDGGAHWRDAGLRLNEVMDVDLNGKKGTWVNEVSSLVYDPSAPPSDRWQLYWHHYLSVRDKGEFSHGWIAYKGAETPEGLATAPEVKLFGGKIYENMQPEADSPLPGSPRISIDKLHTDIEYCVAATEPGAMATKAGVYLALQCIEPPFRGIAGMLAITTVGPKSNIVLLKCNAPCRPSDLRSWQYVGKPVQQDDANPLGARSLAAPNLYMDNNHVFLIVSPVSNRPVNDAYNGCIVLSFAALDQAQMDRDPSGTLIVRKRFEGHPGTFNGACTYQPSIPGSGYLYGEIDFASGKPLFQIFQTGAPH